MANGFCRHCTHEADVSAEQIERSMGILKRTPDACVTEDLYDARLAACRTCEALLHHHTCRYCGCYVQIRALLKEKSCPEPAGSRWP
ncbi:DUF6171 family protein [Paenibacillus vulneris]